MQYVWHPCKLVTYGTLEIGEVPNDALIENAIPKNIK